MSARNGDKARFGKQRKRKMAHRARTQELRAGLTAPVAEIPAMQPSGQPEVIEHQPTATERDSHEHNVLGSAAQTVGSAIGTLAAKVKGVSSKEHEPAHAE